MMSGANTKLFSGPKFILYLTFNHHSVNGEKKEDGEVTSSIRS
jgi:hypothetical protein